MSWFKFLGITVNVHRIYVAASSSEGGYLEYKKPVGERGWWYSVYLLLSNNPIKRPKPSVHQFFSQCFSTFNTMSMIQSEEKTGHGYLLFKKKKPLWFPKTAGHCTFQQTLLKHKKIMHLGQFQARIWCTAEYLLDDVCGIDSGKLHHWCV